MDVTISLQLFDVDAPESSVETAGLLAIDGPEPLTPEPPETHTDAFERYVDEELDTYLDTAPAAQTVYDGIAVILESIIVDVVEDEIEYRFEIDIPAMQTICSNKVDAATGLTAERTIDDDRIADGMQRAADAVDYHFEWVDVISPRSFTDVASAAEDMFPDEGEE